MHFLKWVLSSALTAALAAHGLDCVVMAMPEQAMQCCNRMHCHAHHHRNQNAQDCCKTTPQIQTVIGQPSFVHAVGYSSVEIGLVQSFANIQIIESSATLIARHSHDPPISGSASIVLLRI